MIATTSPLTKAQKARVRYERYRVNLAGSPDMQRALLARSLEWKENERRSNPWYRELNRLRTRAWTIFRGLADGKNPSTELFGCDCRTFRAHIAGQFQAGMEWSNYGQWQMDHIRPCVRFNITDPEQARACFHYTNLQPLWALDNLTKSTR